MDTQVKVDRDTVRRLYDSMAVTLPEMEWGGGKFKIERFTVDVETARAHYGTRAAMEGEYTRYTEDDMVWMSDVTAERLDHMECLVQISQPSCKRVLINGLGLGMLVAGAQQFDHVERIDVVEQNLDIAMRVGAHYSRYDKRVRIHVADAFTIQWLGGELVEGWDVIWHDIWPMISDENLDGMRRLMQRYEPFCHQWQGCWVKDLCEDFDEAQRLMAELIENDHAEPDDSRLRRELSKYTYLNVPELDVLVGFGLVEPGPERSDPYGVLLR